MKKLILIVLLASIILPTMAQKKNSDQSAIVPDKEIKLNEPTRKGGLPLYDALSKRHTTRTYGKEPLSLQELSDLLWCANGVNRADGRRTAPSARNAQEIDIYVFLPYGVYLYEPNDNKLKIVLEEDHRSELSQQKMVVEAPVTLLFVANYGKMEGFSEEARDFYGATDAGYVSQNVYLYCAANNLNTVVMGAIERDPIREMLQFDGKAILAQPVGHPGK